MSFKEQLKSEILPKTVEYYNSGMGINEAIVKAAEDFKLNLDQTDRLMETMNTARVIAHYEKNAEDRTANCDIADKDTIRKLLYADKPQEKSASAGSGAAWGDYSEYFGTERNYRAAKPIEKAASESKPEREPTGFTITQAVEKVAEFSRKMAECRRFAEDSRGMAEAELATDLNKLASMLSAGYEPEKRWAVFKVACQGQLKEVADMVESEMPGHIVKAAAPHLRRLSLVNVVDQSIVDKELSLAKQASEAYDAFSKIDNYIKVFTQHEKRAKDMLRKQASINKVGQSPFPPPSPPPSPPPPHGGGGRRNNDPWMGKSLLNALVPETPKSAKTIYDYLRGSFTTGEDIAAALKPKSEKSDGSLRDYIDNIRRSAIISELKNDDDILKEVDPKILSEAYETLVQMSPEASLNKEVVRAVLRQSVNSIAVSPFDVKQWADLDNVTLKNRLMREGKVVKK